MGFRAVISKLPLVFVIAAPVSLIGAFLLSYTRAEALFSVVQYPFYALSVTLFWWFLLMLIRRSEDGRASVLQVGLFYEVFFLMVMLWGVSAIVLITLLGYEEFFFRAIARGFIFTSAMASWINVTALYGAWRAGRLWERVYPWPFEPQRRR